MPTDLVEQLVEQAKFVGCKQESSHSDCRRASDNSDDWFHVRTRKHNTI